MSRKTGKLRQNKFISVIILLMENLGAKSIKPDFDSYIAKWTILTKVGLLTVTLPSEHDNLFTVFCRFVEPKLSAKIDDLRINKYSGKWNFHYGNENDCIDMFKHGLEKIVIDQYVTDVAFRKFKNGDIIAVMPHEVSDRTGNVTSYMHVGQHSGVNYKGVVQNTKLATEEEYADLKIELTSVGYNVNIVKKQNYDKYLADYKKVSGR